MNDEYIPERDWQDNLDLSDAVEVLGTPLQKQQAASLLEKEYNLAPVPTKNVLPFKIVKITASFSAKKQIRQFEPVEIFMGAEAEINSSNKVEVSKAQRMLFKQTQKMVNDLTKKLGA